MEKLYFKVTILLFLIVLIFLIVPVKAAGYGYLLIYEKTNGSDDVFIFGNPDGLTSGYNISAWPISIATVGGYGSGVHYYGFYTDTFSTGTHTIKQTLPSQYWSLDSVLCEINGSPVASSITTGSSTVNTASFQIQDGALTICTFTNSISAGFLKIIKKTTNRSGTFDFDVSGPNPYSTSLIVPGSSGGEISSESIPLNKGSNYSITETSPDEYWTLDSISCEAAFVSYNPNILYLNPSYATIPITTTHITQNSPTENEVTGIVIFPNRTMSCTLNNSYHKANLTIVKKTTGKDDTFDFTITGPTSSNISVTTNNLSGQSSQIDLYEGDYNISESVEDYWNFDRAECNTSGGLVTYYGDVDIKIYAGGTYTCTFYDKLYGKLKIIKETIGGDDKFNYYINPSPLAPTIDTTLTPGTGEYESIPLSPSIKYNIFETVPNIDWFLSFVDCELDDGTSTGTFVPTGTYVLNPITNGVIDVEVIAGQTTTCHFRNEYQADTSPVFEPAYGYLEIIKRTEGGDETFDYFVSNTPLNPGITTNNHLGSDTFIVTAGTDAYTVLENIIPGGYWVFNSVSCNIENISTGTPVTNGITNVTVLTGQTTHCTFYNSQQGELKIVKETTGGDDTFDFHVSSSPLNPSIETENGDGSESFYLAEGTDYYTISETNEESWRLDSVSCDNGSGTEIDNGIKEVTITAGQTTTCTFDNKRGVLKIVKSTVGGDGTFKFNIDGPTQTSLSVLTKNNTGEQEIYLDPAEDAYIINELAPNDYWELVSVSCDNGSGTKTDTGIEKVTISDGQTTTCTFNNEQKAKLTIQKSAMGEDTTFNFQVQGPTSFNTTVTTSGGGKGTVTSCYSSQCYDYYLSTSNGIGSSSTKTIEPGSYNITETLPNSNWQFSSADCGVYVQTGTGTIQTSTNNTISNIVIIPGTNVSCAFRNKSISHLKLIKNTFGGDGTFNFNIGPIPSIYPPGQRSYSASVSTSGGSGSTTIDVNSSVYSISESLPSGWNQSGIKCSFEDGYPAGLGSIQTIGGNQIISLFNSTEVVVFPGKTTTCTFLNSISSIDIGYLKIIRHIDNDPLSYNATSPSPMAVGSYYLTENTPSDLKLISASCSNGDSISAIDDFSRNIYSLKYNIVSNQITTCTFTYNRQAKLVITKSAINGDGTFDFNVIDDNNNPVGSSSVTTVNGNGQTEMIIDTTFYYSGKYYSVAETLPSSQWQLSDVSCYYKTDYSQYFYVLFQYGTTKTGTPASDGIGGIKLFPGGTTYCEFSNTKPKSDYKLTVEKKAMNGDGTFNFTMTGGPNPLNFSITTVNGKGSYEATNLVSNISYAIKEEEKDGYWTFNSANCGYSIKNNTTGLWQPYNMSGTIGTKNGIAGLMFGNQPSGAEKFTCTFTNTLGSRLKIVKNTLGGDNSFSFFLKQSTSSSYEEKSRLKTVNGVGSFEMDLPPGKNYEVFETTYVPSGFNSNGSFYSNDYQYWKSKSILCDKPYKLSQPGESVNIGLWNLFNIYMSPIAKDVNLVPGQTTTCTFVNTRQGTLGIVKKTDGDDGSFDFYVSPGSAGTSVETQNGSGKSWTTYANYADGSSYSYGLIYLDPGKYSVFESVPRVSWVLNSTSCSLENGSLTGKSTASGIESVSILPGQMTTCTFNNGTKLTPREGVHGHILEIQGGPE